MCVSLVWRFSAWEGPVSETGAHCGQPTLKLIRRLPQLRKTSPSVGGTSLILADKPDFAKEQVDFHARVPSASISRV